MTRALRRHWFLLALVWSCFVTLAVAAAVMLPREYWTETKLLARKNSIMPALVHPQRTIPSSSDAPTQSASELVHERDVLLSIVREGRLAEHWAAARPPLFRLKDELRARLLGSLTQAQVEDALVEMLDRRLRLEWLPSAKDKGGKVVREVTVK